MSSSLIHFLPGQRFECSACGKCCRKDWRVDLEPEVVDRIRQTKAYENVTRQGYEALRIVDDRVQLNRHADATCMFQEGDLCGLHEELGLENKPLACKLYPFHLVDTPDGVFVSLNFSCPAVMDGWGGPVLSHQSFLEGLLATERSSDKPKENVTLRSGLEWTWPDYVQWESACLEQLSKTEDPREALANSLQPLGCEPQAVRAMGLVLSQQLIAVLEKPEDAQERAVVLAALQHGVVQDSSLAHCELEQLEAPLALSSQVVRELLQEYMRNQVFGKRLVSGPTLLVRALALLSFAEVFVYYFELQRLRDGERHFRADHAEWAFDLIEDQAYNYLEQLLPMYSAAESRLSDPLPPG